MSARIDLMTLSSDKTTYLSVKEVADHLDCSPETVHRAIARGHLPALKYGRLVRISRTDFDAFVERFTTKGEQRARRKRR